MQNLKEAFIAILFYMVPFLTYFLISGRVGSWSSLTNVIFTAAFLPFAALFGMTQKFGYLAAVAAILALGLSLASKAPPKRRRYVFAVTLLAFAAVGTHAMQLIAV